MRKVLFIFGVLNDSDIDWMARAGSRRRIRRQEVLIHEGVPIDAVVLLLQGRMGVSVSGAGEIAQIEAGGFIGGVSLGDSGPPPAPGAAKVGSGAPFPDQQVPPGKPAGGQRFAQPLFSRPPL